MNTTAGFTCSATATNASPRSAAGLAAGIWRRGPLCNTTGDRSAASPRLGRLSAEAKANPNTNAIATSAPNFSQSRVRTDIVSPFYDFLFLSSSTIS